MYEIGITCGFSAAHRMRNYKGRCEALHGHNYKVELVVYGDTLVNGMLMDFVLLKQKANDIIKKMDHTYLNEIEPFTKQEPSVENIARHIYESLCAGLPNKVYPDHVKVWESDGNWALYRIHK